MGSKVVEFIKATKSMGDSTVMDGFDYVFKSNERIVLLEETVVGNQLS